MKRIFLFFFTIFLFNSNDSYAQTTDYSPAYKKAIGEAFVFYQKKEFAKSMAAFEKAFNIYDKDAIDLYNAACLSSLLGNQKQAYQYLSKGIKNGYLDTEWMAGDQDLAALKASKYWKKIPKLVAKSFAKIEKDFEIVQKIPLTDLVPFQHAGKWGYLNKNDKSIAVPANYHKVSFGGNCLKIQPTKGIRLRVRPGGEVSSHHLFKKRSKKKEVNDLPVKYEIMDDSDFDGFVITNGVLAGVSSKYQDASSLKINGKWYAIVKKGGKFGLIDENGKAKKYFNFRYLALKHIADYKGNDTWFYFEDENHKKGFINTSNEKRFYDAFDDYPFSKPCVMKLARVTKGNRQGIIDLTNLEWLLEPIEEIIIRVDYSYVGDCDKTPTQLREVVKDFYVLVKNASGKEYYIWQ